MIIIRNRYHDKCQKWLNYKVIHHGGDDDDDNNDRLFPAYADILTTSVGQVTTYGFNKFMQYYAAIIRLTKIDDIKQVVDPTTYDVQEDLCVTVGVLA